VVVLSSLRRHAVPDAVAIGAAWIGNSASRTPATSSLQGVL